MKQIQPLVFKFTKSLFVLVCLQLLVSCSLLKTVRILKSGETKQKHFKVEVPFEMRMGVIVLKVKVNGVEAEYLLDTGAPNVISKELAQQIKLTAKTVQKTGDSQGKKSELEYAKIACINIGGIDFLETGTAIADLKQSGDVACLKADGFIGANLMRLAIWKFDYNKQVITICSSRDSLKLASGYKKLPFKPVVSGTPKIEVTYNGYTDKNVTLDLGSNGDFVNNKFTLDNIKKAGSLVPIKQSYGQEGSGLYGKAAADTTYYALLDTIKFGELTLTRQMASFGRLKAKTVGTNFFKNQDLIFDWSKNEVLLLERKPYNNNIKRFQFSVLFKDNKLFVASVDANAASDGPLLGDQILSINGRDYSVCSANQWCDILYDPFTKKENDLELKILRDGKEKVIYCKSKLLFDKP